MGGSAAVMEQHGLTLQYCPAEAEDVSTIFNQCEMLIRTYEDTDAIDLPKVLTWVENKIRANIHQYVCVKLNGCKVAYYRLDRSGAEMELDDFYVLPEFRGRGIGTQILRKCIENVDLPIYLYVFKKNTGAIRLYERLGFSVSESVGQTRLIMRRNPG